MSFSVLDIVFLFAQRAIQNGLRVLRTGLFVLFEKLVSILLRAKLAPKDDSVQLVLKESVQFS